MKTAATMKTTPKMKKSYITLEKMFTTLGRGVGEKIP